MKNGFRACIPRDASSRRRIWKPLCVFASRLSSTAPVTPSSLSGPVVGELHLGAELVGERDQGEVLCVQMLLDLERVVEDGVCVFVGLLSAFVGGGRLDVLADDDDRQEDELQERLGD